MEVRLALQWWGTGWVLRWKQQVRNDMALNMVGRLCYLLIGVLCCLNHWQQQTTKRGIGQWALQPEGSESQRFLYRKFWCTVTFFLMTLRPWIFPKNSPQTPALLVWHSRAISGVEGAVHFMILTPFSVWRGLDERYSSVRITYHAFSILHHHHHYQLNVERFCEIYKWNCRFLIYLLSPLLALIYPLLPFAYRDALSLH